jgi:hypothetical protein
LCLKFKKSEASKENEDFGCPDHQMLFKTELENFIVQSAMKWFGKSENAVLKQERRFMNQQRTKIRLITVKQTAAAAYRMKAIKRAVKRQVKIVEKPHRIYNHLKLETIPQNSVN